MRNSALMRFVWVLLFAACSTQQAYLDRYFHTFPTRATAAGRHDVARQLESPHGAHRASWRERRDASDRASWLSFNQQARAKLAGRSDLDSRLLARAVDREIFALAVLH